MKQLDVKVLRLMGRINREFKLKALENVSEHVCEDKAECDSFKQGKLCDVAKHDVDMLMRGYWYEFCRWN